MELISQIIIALITTTVSSIFAYLHAVKKLNTIIEAIKINANNEIKKIREESQKELNRIKTESAENIKTKLVENELELKQKEETLKYDAMGPFFQEILKNPKKAEETIKRLQNLSTMLQNNK